MKFGRKRREQPEQPEQPEQAEQAGETGPAGTPPAGGEADEGAPAAASAPADDAVAAGREKGPWDISEVTLDEEDGTRVDLGGLVVKGAPGVELRLQVDEKTQEVAAVLLVGQEGGLELRAFAAPRNRDIWAEIRRQIAAETARRGGTATEAKGVYGPELQVAMPVTMPDGQAGTQPSRVMGILGPRWLLRATYLGQAALDPHATPEIQQALRDVVVRRGEEAMAPGDPLPLQVPSNARRTTP